LGANGPTRRSECSTHKTFVIRLGRTFASEYHERTIRLRGSLVPIVLPIASLYGADHDRTLNKPFYALAVCHRLLPQR
jgi:hypothetical protein